MYTPESMRMVDPAAAYALIDRFSFGLLVSPTLEATHLPFILAPTEGEQGALYSHCARANPHWQQLEGQPVLAVFQGPHAYVSPTWYARAPAAPTWNYVAVHVTGTARLVDANVSLGIVEATVRKHEPALLEERTILTDAFRDRLMPGLVGFRIAIEQIEGKEKLGQHRSPADQRGVFRALSRSEDGSDQALAEYMRNTGRGTGEDR